MPTATGNAIVELRERIITYLSNGLYEQARNALEYILVSEETSRHRTWLDVYRYCLVLETSQRESAYLAHVIKMFLGTERKRLEPAVKLLFECVQSRLSFSHVDPEIACSAVNKCIEQLLTANHEWDAQVLLAQNDIVPLEYRIKVSSRHLIASLKAFVSKAQVGSSIEAIARGRDLWDDAVEKDKFIDKSIIAASNQSLVDAQRYFEHEQFEKYFVGNFGIEYSQIIELYATALAEAGNLVDLCQLSHRLDRSENKASLYVRGLFKQLSESPDEARKCFRQATKLDKTYIPAWLSLGHSYSAIGDHEQAVVCYNRILNTIDNHNGPSLVSLASEYLRVGRPKQAGPYLHQALTLNSDDRNALNELGVYLFSRGEYQDAIESLSKAERLSKTSTFRSQIVRNRLIVTLLTATEHEDEQLFRQTVEQLKPHAREHPFCLEILAHLEPDHERRRSLISQVIALYHHRRYESVVKRLQEFYKTI